MIMFSQLFNFHFFYSCLFWPTAPLGGRLDQKKTLVHPKDYPMWHTLRVPQISGDGNWISYRLDYNQREDTLYVIDKKGKSPIALPNSHSGQFSTSKRSTVFVFKDNKKGVGILSLKTRKIEWIGTDRFEFSDDGNYLACYSPNSQNGYLKVSDISKNKTREIKGIRHFSFSPNGDYAVLIKKDTIKTSLELLNLSNMSSSVILSSNNSKYLLPTWNLEGNALAFIETTISGNQRVYYFENKGTPLLKELNNIDLKKMGNMGISSSTLFFSDDGERVFFSTYNKINKPIEDDSATVKVQVWKGGDKLVYSQQELDWDFNTVDRLAVWWPHQKKVFQIGNDERPMVLLTGDQKYAISYNSLTYGPQFHEFPQNDYYITNLETGEIKLFAEKLETVLDDISMSPNGEYIAYFKNCNWWIYNVKTNHHQKVSSGIRVPCRNEDDQKINLDDYYGKMGWTKSNEFLVYDEFDIWKLNPDDSTHVRLTNGKRNKICYRQYKALYHGFYPLGKKMKFSGFDLSENLIFATRDSLFNQGYALLKPNGTIDHFLSRTGRISELRKAKFTNLYIFIKEKNDSPPAMCFLDGRKSKILFQSNSHQERFKIGQTKVVSFKNMKGENLNGLLHYPDDYVVGKQYPMIVHVYEMVAHRFQFYKNPDQYNEDGFNYRNLTAAGYFVLEPDILIQKGNPGISASDCVMASLNKVLESGMIKKNAIGIIGHSFGGYETAFIITQTD